MIIIKHFICNLILLILILLCSYQLFIPLYQAEEVIVSFGLNPSDICYDNPLLWKYLKISFIFFYIFSNFIILNSLISRFHIFPPNQKQSSQPSQNSSSLKLLIGKNMTSNQKIYLPESGLYQNFLITGTIGTGKTSSAMYPFTEQFIRFNSRFRKQKNNNT